MTEEKIQKLLNKLKELKYKSDILGRKEDFPVIDKKNFDKVENVIRQFLLDNHDAEYGELQAKVYAYEKIIANSNFAPIMQAPRNDGPRPSENDAPFVKEGEDIWEK